MWRGCGCSRGPVVRRIGGPGATTRRSLRPGVASDCPTTQWGGLLGGYARFAGGVGGRRGDEVHEKSTSGAVFAPFGALRGPSPPRRGRGRGPTVKSGIDGQKAPHCFVSRNGRARVAPRRAPRRTPPHVRASRGPRSGCMTAADHRGPGPTAFAAHRHRRAPGAVGAGPAPWPPLPPLFPVRPPATRQITRPPSGAGPQPSASATGGHPTRWVRARPSAALAAAFQSSPPVARQTDKAAQRAGAAPPQPPPAGASPNVSSAPVAVLPAGAPPAMRGRGLDSRV
ncbi:hypothetical protein EKD16_13915 [Streptomonospora litoralis]|uniref:Uncharacterized protein n=1 Tax=Streptomonospora litoralis TaxID=2498135 RepID=A0A4P6Q1Y7_9ACTN|nr:hypothetical protein EKD16_13915 [Streptomonospora litoralis]